MGLMVTIMNYQEFKEELESVGLTVKTFAEKSNAAYASMTNCSSNGRDMPPWVESWLNLYKDASRFRTIKSALKEE